MPPEAALIGATWGTYQVPDSRRLVYLTTRGELAVVKVELRQD
jgi:hypothetical protein